MRSVEHLDMAWQEVGRRRVYERYGRGIDEVRFVLPTGRSSTFTIHVDRPSVAVLALTTDGRVILTRQFRPGPREFVCEMPGGYVDEGESPTEAARRELSEETGYRPGTVTSVASCYAGSYSGAKRYSVLAVDCRLPGCRTGIACEPDEFVKVEILSVEDFRSRLRSGRVMDIDLAYLALDEANLI